MEGTSPKSKMTALLLCIFLGGFGAQQFYVGKIGAGVLRLLTVGGFCGILSLIDLIKICTNKFQDKDGLLVTN